MLPRRKQVEATSVKVPTDTLHIHTVNGAREMKVSREKQRETQAPFDARSVGESRGKRERTKGRRGENEKAGDAAGKRVRKTSKQLEARRRPHFMLPGIGSL